MVEFFVAKIAQVRLDASVGAAVVGKVAAVSKTLVAEVAGVRLLTCVDTIMLD